jgi:hypothetical protein
MYVVQKKMIGGVMRTVRMKLVPLKDIPEIDAQATQPEPKKGFEFVINPDKNVTKNTLKTYKGQLNKMYGALGYKTVGQLINKHSEILAWLRITYPDISKQKLFMSSVFYMLNRKPFIKMGVAKPYYDEFQKMKKAQIEDNAKKGKLKPEEIDKALEQISANHWKQ